MRNFTEYQMKKLLFPILLATFAASSKNLFIWNEEIIVAACFLTFILVARKSFGVTLQNTLQERTHAINHELQQVFQPNLQILLEYNQNEVLFRKSLALSQSLIKALPTARTQPKIEKSIEAAFTRKLTEKLERLLSTNQARKSQKMEDLIQEFRVAVNEQWTATDGVASKRPAKQKTNLALISEGLQVLKTEASKNL